MVYEDLKWEDPGDAAAAVRSRLRAQRQGWAAYADGHGTTETPPTASADDVDEVAVNRAVAGDPAHLPTHLRPVEQQAALRRLAGTLPDNEIAQRLGVATRTVSRHRTKQGLPAYTPTMQRPADDPRLSIN